jgi:hypothetical protein
VLVEPVVDEAIIARLASSNADLARGNEAARLVLRYRDRYDHIVKPAPVTREELLADLATARDLADNRTATGPGGSHDAPAAVAAAALEARFRDELDVPGDDVVWAAGLLILLVNGLADQGASEDDSSVFGHGLDRSAARALPLLWLPAAHSVRERLAAEGTATGTPITTAATMPQLRPAQSSRSPLPATTRSSRRPVWTRVGWGAAVTLDLMTASA